MAAACSDMPVRVGTAGWAIPAAVRDTFPAGGSQLERYAARLNAVEINSSFYRPHRRTTYERWASSVPDAFRFAVKLPRTVTHERRLAACGDLLARFADEVAGLGGKRGPVLVQLPPSLVFDAAVADAFFEAAAALLGGDIACEPRHASWFAPAADRMLADRRIGRVAADPSPVAAGAGPGGWRGLGYQRLHGTPRIYYSGYDEPAIAGHAVTARAAVAEHWTIYDNTAAGHALPNALDLAARLAADRR